MEFSSYVLLPNLKFFLSQFHFLHSAFADGVDIIRSKVIQAVDFTVQLLLELNRCIHQVCCQYLFHVLQASKVDS